MSDLMQMIRDLAERHPEPDLSPIHTVAPFPKCANCLHFDVLIEGDTCEQCTREFMQGYEVLAMLGRLSNGAERDHGTLYHAVPFGSRKALCGAKPGKRSVGWTFDPAGHGTAITCPKCLKRSLKFNAGPGDEAKPKPAIDRKELAMWEEVVNAVQKTDIEERELIAYEVCSGSALLWPRMILRGITPMGLFVASLVDAESPLVMRGEVLIHNSLVGCAEFVKDFRPEFFELYIQISRR